MAKWIILVVAISINSLSFAEPFGEKLKGDDLIYEWERHDGKL